MQRAQQHLRSATARRRVKARCSRPSRAAPISGDRVALHPTVHAPIGYTCAWLSERARCLSICTSPARRAADRYRAASELDAAGDPAALPIRASPCIRTGSRSRRKSPISNRSGGRDRRRRHQPRLPADYRSAARRPGWYKCSTSCALAQQAHVYPIGALTVVEGRHDHRDGRARRGRLHRVLTRRRRGRRHAGAAARAAIRRDFRLSRLVRPQTPPRARRRRARMARSRRAGLPAFRLRRNDRARHDLRAGTRDRVHVHLARLSTHDGVARVRAAKKRACGHLDVAIHHVHLSTSTSAGSTALPSGAAARGTRPRCAASRPCRRYRRSICSDHTPVDDDANSCPSQRRSPARPRSSCSCLLTLKLGG